MDEELREKELVAEPSYSWSAVAVNVVDAADECECERERAFDVAIDGFAGRRNPRCVLEFGGDAGLFFAGEVAGDAAVDDAAGEATSFVFEFGDALFRPADFGFGVPALPVKLDTQPFTDFILQLVRESHGAVVVFDGVFDVVGRHVGLGAVVGLLVTAEAEEVVVGAAVAVGAGEAEA